MKEKPEQPYAGPLRAALGMPDNSVETVANRASYHMDGEPQKVSGVSFGISVAIMLDMMRETVNVESE